MYAQSNDHEVNVKLNMTFVEFSTPMSLPTDNLNLASSQIVK